MTASSLLSKVQPFTLSCLLKQAFGYYSMPLILQQPVAKISSEVRPESQMVAPLHGKDIMENLQRFVANIPWGHNILLMQKIKDLPTRLWYIRQAIEIFL